MRKHYPLNAAGAEDAGLLPWTDGVPATGVEGSYPGHALITDTEAEVLAAAAAAGLVASGTDLTQLAQAISRGIYVGGFTGSANALAASLPNSVVFPSLLPGMRFQGIALATNTAAVTLTLSGFATPPGSLGLLRRNGGAMKEGDLPVGVPFSFVFDGAAYRMAVPVPSEIRDVASPASTALWHSGVVGGTISAVTATVSPAITAYEDRTPILLSFPNGIASGATGALNGLAPIPFQRNDGSAIQSTDIPPGAQAAFSVVGTGALRLIGVGRGEIQRIVINPTLFVRIDGNDANDGLSNTAGGAFRTIRAALMRGTSQFNFASSALNVRLGQAGEYESPGEVPRGTGTINIVGDAAAPGSYIVTGAGQPGQGSIQVAGPVNFDGLTLRNTGAQSHTLAATSSGLAIVSNVRFQSTQATAGSHAFTAGGDIVIASGCSMEGSAACALNASDGKVSVSTSVTLQILGTPTFSTATARAFGGGKVDALAGSSVTGSANGKRYETAVYGIITTNGGGENFFPGSTPGTRDNGLYL
ncbi:hypothetical protein ABEV34_11855 [Methylorubrum rhodesianum]|uniref:hypothetical protein n=1 Tax=Methylorubrum TaxID=2282523 RepID=UPI0016206491|nr:MULTISPECIES: hypothetical protein [Methylorubrum]MBB5765715.1 outer membrane protein assembly factor BamB [Methylorubrum rhodesianum]MBI1691517.1 hypothetical protein [Methylorubrum sp. DB1722]